MAVVYTHAKPGNRFVLTALGMSQGKIREKYNKSNFAYKKAYEISVPSAWIREGYVKEVKCEEAK